MNQNLNTFPFRKWWQGTFRSCQFDQIWVLPKHVHKHYTVYFLNDGLRIIYSRKHHPFSNAYQKWSRFWISQVEQQILRKDLLYLFLILKIVETIFFWAYMLRRFRFLNSPYFSFFIQQKQFQISSLKRIKKL